MFSSFIMPEERKGIWFKPYALFENVQLRGGEDVSNVSYGTIVGGESELLTLKRGWYSLYGAYVSYNGSHQNFAGNGIYNNGGLVINGKNLVISKLFFAFSKLKDLSEKMSIRLFPFNTIIIVLSVFKR